MFGKTFEELHTELKKQYTGNPGTGLPVIIDKTEYLRLTEKGLECHNNSNLISIKKRELSKEEGEKYESE